MDECGGQVLDKALTRPGRFDRHVVVPNPDIKGRTQILGLHIKEVPVSADVNLEVVARGTPGFSGADLANVVNIAAIKASQDNKTQVSMADLEYAKDRIMMGAERKSAVVSRARCHRLAWLTLVFSIRPCLARCVSAGVSTLFF